MANAGSSNNNTSVLAHEAATGGGRRVVDDWHEPYYDEPAPVTPPKAPKRPLTAARAAKLIRRWLVWRFDKVFWYCARCSRRGPALPEHHSRISNFGICESCHNDALDDDLQADVNDHDMGRTPSDPDYTGYSTGGCLRWVGPRFERDNSFASRVQAKRLDPFYWHKKQFDRYHEELMAVAWHPSRVAKWLEQGEDVLDMMMGVD
jgi:hypothetical protein